MPTLASTSRAQLRYIVESVFGETPGSGNHYRMRFTGESLAFALGTEKSKEIRSDRQVTDLVLSSAQANGGVNFELSYNELDHIIEAALQGTWVEYGTAGVGSTFTADFAADSITADAAPTGDNAFTILQKGQWIKVIAPTHANDGKYVKVSEVTAPTTTVITLDAATPLAVGTDVALCAVASSRLANAATQRSFTVEREFNDIDKFFPYRGMTVSKMSLTFQSGQIVNGSFDFLGKDMPGVEEATTLLGTEQASLTYDIMNAVSGVGQIMEAGSLLTGTYIKSLTLSIDNKLRVQDAIGVLGAAGIGSGTIDVTGSMQVYLADGTLYDKFVQNLSSSLSLRMDDGDGNGYAISFPKIKYSDAKVAAGAQDQDAMLDLPFQALMGGDYSKTMFVDRMGVAVTRA